MTSDIRYDNRIDYLDMAKAIGIVLVIIGHIVPSDTDMKRIIYSFHMPLFFIVSGMLISTHKKLSKKEWKDFLIKKVKGLLLPYFVWALIYSSFTIKNLVLVTYGTRESLICAESLSSLWFLPTMFGGFLLSEIVIQIACRYDKYFILLVSIGMVLLAILGSIIPHYITYGDLWSFDIAFVAAAFILGGSLLRLLLNRIQTITWLKILLLICSVLGFTFAVHYSSSSVGYVLMANAEYGNRLLFFLVAILGSLSILLFSFLLEFLPRKQELLWIGRRTLGIFVIHKSFIDFGKSILSHIRFDVDTWCGYVLIFCFSLIASIICVIILERIFPEVIGIKKRERIQQKGNI